MKILLLTNDNGTNGDNQTGYETNFACNFNEIVSLPEDCQMAILSYNLKDQNAKKIHYLEVSNIPLYTNVGNRESGQVRSILGPLVSNNEYCIAGQYLTYDTTDATNPILVYPAAGDGTGNKTLQWTDQGCLNIGQFLVPTPLWIDLDNPAQIDLTYINCRITNQNGVESEGTSSTDPVEIMIGYRKKPKYDM